MSQTPPHSLESERALLGGLLLDFQQFHELAQMVTANDFFHGPNQRIWQYMARCAANHEGLDVLGLADHVMTSRTEQQFGGLDYITSLPEQVPSTANLSYYAIKVRDHAARRRIIQQAERAIQQAQDGGDPVALAEALGQHLKSAVPSALTNLAMIGDVVDSALGVADEALLSGGPKRGILSGLRAYDDMAGPMLPGEVYLVAGRPGSGKTSFVQMVLLHAAMLGAPCHFDSLEMQTQQIAMRLMSNRARVSFSKMIKGRVDISVEWPRLEGAAEELVNAPLSINDKAGQSLADLRRSISTADREFRRRGLGGVKLWAIDYLQLVSRGDTRPSNDVEHLTHVAQGVKAIAKDHNVALLALVQLNRGVESRADKRPTMGDIQGAGAFEQVATGITAIYRDDYYNPGSRKPGEAELIILKSRHDQTGTARVRFISDWTLFTDLNRPAEKGQE